MSNTLHKFGVNNVQKLVKIMNAGVGHLVGLEDIINRRQTTTNLKCVSFSGTLLTIGYVDFLRIVKRDKELWAYFI